MRIGVSKNGAEWSVSIVAISILSALIILLFTESSIAIWWLIALGTFGLVSLAIETYYDIIKSDSSRRSEAPLRRRLARKMALHLTVLAASLGGRTRTWRAEEFRADLTRSETDSAPTSRGQLRYAIGLVYATLRMRARDLTQPLRRYLLRVLDWTLAQPRTEWIVTWLTLAATAYFWRTKHFDGLMEQLQNVATVAAIYGPALWLRKRRNISPVRRSHNHEQAEPERDI
ncbi:hypothetical protein [Actinomadura sp. WMMA1423]|uniref:hypothetical protein n=1 Tax=Actinomadura sp. WMMA1423 TaxID=2591108 RepID=UPI001146DB1E|nr:hypothetical protein [Actinomadura sp. WMMA1423]